MAFSDEPSLTELLSIARQGSPPGPAFAEAVKIAAKRDGWSKRTRTHLYRWQAIAAGHSGDTAEAEEYADKAISTSETGGDRRRGESLKYFYRFQRLSATDRHDDPWLSEFLSKAANDPELSCQISYVEACHAVSGVDDVEQVRIWRGVDCEHLSRGARSHVLIQLSLALSRQEQRDEYLRVLREMASPRNHTRLARCYANTLLAVVLMGTDPEEAVLRADVALGITVCPSDLAREATAAKANAEIASGRAEAAEELRGLLGQQGLSSTTRLASRCSLLQRGLSTGDIKQACTAFHLAAGDPGCPQDFRDLCAMCGSLLATGLDWFDVQRDAARFACENDNPTEIGRVARGLTSGVKHMADGDLAKAESSFVEVVEYGIEREEPLRLFIDLCRLFHASVLMQQMRMKDALAGFREIAADDSVHGEVRNTATLSRATTATLVGEKHRLPDDLDRDLPCPDCPVDAARVLTDFMMLATEGEFEAAFHTAEACAANEMMLPVVRRKAHAMAAMSGVCSGRFVRALSHANSFIALSAGSAASSLYARFVRGFVLLIGGKPTQAIEDFRAASGSKPEAKNAIASAMTAFQKMAAVEVLRSGSPPPSMGCDD